MASEPTPRWTFILRSFLRLSLALTLLVVLAGSVVRMTGSGMGCPDWPRCFGQTIPPTRMDQVLWNPLQTYAEGQMVLHHDTLWTANGTAQPQSVFNRAQWSAYTKHNYATFVPAHTWIEFINRLLGAALGIPVFLAFAWSISRYRAHRKWVAALLLGLVLLLFEAWLGKVVVDGNLVPHHITYHLLGAFGLLAVFTAVHRSVSTEAEAHSWFFEEQSRSEQTESAGKWLALFAALLLVQISTGALVRESVDGLRATTGTAVSSQLTSLVYVHRTYSLLLVGLTFYLLRKTDGLAGIRARVGLMAGLALAETALGAVLYYFNIPRSLQPLHLLFSAFLFVLAVDAAVLAFLQVRSHKRLSAGA